MASGSVVAAIATTEPGAHSYRQKVGTTAVRDGDAYVISGVKSFIANCAQADLLLVLARTPAATQCSPHPSLILVEVDRAGFHRNPVKGRLAGTRANAAEMTFDNVRVPTSNLLGGIEGRGLAQLLEQLPQERLIVVLGSVVGMEAALEPMVRDANAYRVFGESIDNSSRFAALADATTDVRVARELIDDCVIDNVRGRLDDKAVAVAQRWVTQRSVKTVGKCLQVHRD